MSQSRRLMVLPCEAGTGDGYSLAVAADLARLAPREADVVVARIARKAPPRNRVRRLETPGRLAQAWNLLRGRPTSEIAERLLRRALAGAEGPFDEIFAGEIFFYRALRRMFPEALIRVRTHNLFSLVRCRQWAGRLPTSLRHAVNVFQYSRLEREILADPKVALVFITAEEEAFARLLWPGLRGEWWPVVEPGLAPAEDIRPPRALRVVHYGSTAAAHTAIGVERLCRRVWPGIRARLPGAELHLFGHGSERFDDRARGIHGHGRHGGEGLPLAGEALFCVPDIHGMGIKLKVADLLKAGVPFITTPLGLSGYRLPPHPHILVRELEDWAEAIPGYFLAQGLSGPGAG
jgi:hypothetical protein